MNEVLAEDNSSVKIRVILISGFDPKFGTCAERYLNYSAEKSDVHF